VASVFFPEDATMPDVSTHAPYDPAATRRWVGRLERFAARGQTVAAFCAAEGVSQSNFYLWRRRLAQALPGPASVGPMVVPLHITPAPASAVELALPSGGVLRFPADARPELIAAVLRGLEGRPC
jgi:transposase